MTRKKTLAALLAALASGCASSASMGVMAGPAAGMQNAAADDHNIVQSIAEGGVPNRPYVLDGTVRSVWSRSLIVQSELGYRHVWTTPSTTITVDGAEATLAEVKPGARIRVAYNVTGLARDIDVGPDAVKD